MDQNNSTRFKQYQAVVVLKREVDVKLMAFLPPGYPRNNGKRILVTNFSGK
jgi:hypothetical protein